MSKIDVNVGDKVFWSDIGYEESSIVRAVTPTHFEMYGPGADAAGHLLYAWYDRTKLFRNGDKLCANIGG